MNVDIIKNKKVEQELIKLNSIKSELLIRISHELKTPLTSIKGFSNLLFEFHRDKLDEPVGCVIENIKQGCARLEYLIGDILNTVKLESGMIQLRKSEESLSDLIKLCVNELKEFLEMRNHGIRLKIQDNLLSHFEKNKIHQVIGNILINAIK